MRRWLGYAGAGAVAVGLVLLVADGFAPDVGGTVAVFVVAAVAVMLGVGAAMDGYFEPGERSSPPDAERGYTVRVPGDDLDPAADDASKRLAFKRRIRRNVTRTLVDRYGYSTAAAETSVEDGAWTDDPVAAAFVGDGRVELPLPVRLRWRLLGVDRDERSAEHAVEALASLREGDR